MYIGQYDENNYFMKVSKLGCILMSILEVLFAKSIFIYMLPH